MKGKFRRMYRQGDMGMQEQKHLVSILIPTYNQAELFSLAMQSAVAQTYPALEILVCDNSTNEDTARVMEAYLDDPRVHYFRNREARTKAENFSVFREHAKGEYLQWLMHDDLLAPDKIAKMADWLRKRKDITLVTSQRGIIDAAGHETEETKARQSSLPIEGEYQVFDGESIAKLTLQTASNFLGEPSAVLFRRADLEDAYWDAAYHGYRVISDIAMWLALLEKGDCVVYREPLSWYRRHAQQEGQQLDVILRSRVEWFRLATEYHERGVFVAAWEEYTHFFANFLEEYQREYPLLRAAASPEAAAEYEACMEEMKTMLSTHRG